jgi:site-specific recombinase XerD
MRSDSDDTLVGAHGTDLRLHRYRSATTEATYTSHLGTFRTYLADQFPDLTLPDVHAVHVKAYLLALAARGIAPATRSSALFALRSFYEHLRSEDLLDINPTAKIKVPGARKLHTEVYTDAEADSILAWAASQTKRRWRIGYVVLATLRYTGLRSNEIACCASTRWTWTPDASRSSGRVTSRESCRSLPRSFPSSRTT